MSAVIGIHDGHNASVALIRDGRLELALQEERLTRVKNQGDAPAGAAGMARRLMNGGAGSVQVALNGHYMNYDQWRRETILADYERSASLGSRLKQPLKGTFVDRIYQRRKAGERGDRLASLGFAREQLVPVEHHLAHASAAYYTSPWKSEKVLVVTCDGSGDRLSATLSTGERGRLTRIAEISEHDSIGRLYALVTRSLGMTPLEHEYFATPTAKLDELTSILVEGPSGVKDQTTQEDVSPLESQRSWERQAEANIVARLEKGGLLAPPGPVDEVLNTVVNNLIVSANLNVEAHCRVLLTTPMETFAVGHTIVISRGLIDVLPDEPSLALVLADELAHIALGHRTQTQFAFHNQTMLSDAEMLQRLHFERSPLEMLAAGRKTIEIMRASPYQKTANAGLFLKALAGRNSALPRLLQANLGNQVADPDALARLAGFAASAPALEEDKLEQIAALPLGSRVKLDPWTNQITLVKTRPLSLLSPREKMPFEVTPFVLYLTHVDAGPAKPAEAN
jgi:carbamoyltransferase-like protein/peptidase M48-like protein